MEINGEVLIAVAVLVVGGIVTYVLVTRTGKATTAPQVPYSGHPSVYTAPPNNTGILMQSPAQANAPPQWIQTSTAVVNAIPGVVNDISQIAKLFN